jgi:sugar lactone lactonase YvrE
MILRMAALDGPFPTLDRMAVLPDAWPAGQVPYLFGESFLRYLSDRFGREKIAALSRAYSGRTLPFLVESTGRDVLGEGYRDLWEQWSAELRKQARATAQAVAAGGSTPSAALTTDGRLNISPAWSPDGRRIAWLRADGSDDPGIWIMDADGSNGRRLVKNAFSTTSSAAALGWSPDGARLYYTRQGFVRGAAVVNDVWAWDFAAGREVRVTRGLHARDAQPSPDGRTLALVTAGGGLTRLSLLDLDGEPLPVAAPSRLRPLTEPSAEQFAEPRWSPDGDRIAVSVWEPGGEKGVRILDRSGNLLARVGTAGALDGAPSWSPDGQRLYFSSDATGIYNLFRWDARTSGVERVTNVVGGAFAPAVSPDGRTLAYADYTARGFDIRLLELDALPPAGAGKRGRGAPPDGAPQGLAAGAPRRQDPAAPTGAADAPRPYTPLDTILPRLWFPWLAHSPASGTLAGFVTGGQDVLERHRYTLTALYGPRAERLMHWADYSYDGLRPTLSLSSSDADRTYGGLLRDGRRSADYTERRRSLGAAVTLDFPGFDSSQSATIGYRYRELSALTPDTPWPGYAGRRPATGPLGSTRLTWSFSDARRQPLSVSPSGGRRVGLDLEHYQRGFGSASTFTVASLDWSEYFALPAPRHVLAARFFAGVISGGPPQQGVFGLGGGVAGEVDAAREDQDLRLRGFAPGSFRGERAVLASLEYRFPLLEVGRGGVSFPLFLRRLHGAVFVDAGEGWDAGEFRPSALHAGVGAEIRLDMLLSYSVPLTVRLGVAAGLDSAGGVYPTLGLSLPLGLTGSGARRQ